MNNKENTRQLEAIATGVALAIGGFILLHAPDIINVIAKEGLLF